MTDDPIDILPQWVLTLLSIALTWLALEAGYRLGRWRHARVSEEKETPVGAMVAAILGLLAFMLAFTFGLASSRFDARRMTVVEEANAIGTTYLRTKLLPEPQDREIAKLLRDYVDVRLRAAKGGKLEEGLAKSEKIQTQIWNLAMEVAREDRHPIMTGLFIQSLNEMIDVHGKRVFASIRSRIPVIIWISLFALAMLGTAATGYQCGLSATRRSPAMIALVIAFAGVMFLIVDLDRGQEGFLTVDQSALIDLQKSMRASD